MKIYFETLLDAFVKDSNYVFMFKCNISYYKKSSLDVTDVQMNLYCYENYGAIF